MKPWRRTARRRVLRCGIFDLDQVDYAPPDDDVARSFYVIEAPDWINVIPLTADRQVLLVRQYRFGIADHTLEIPGGMCDPGESPAAAAARELQEETGHAAEELIELGWVHPNPPIQNNRCFTFLAPRVRPVAQPTPDPSERIEIVPVPLADIPDLVRRGAITHALVLAAFHLLDGSAGAIDRAGA